MIDYQARAKRIYERTEQKFHEGALPQSDFIAITGALGLVAFADEQEFELLVDENTDDLTFLLTMTTVFTRLDPDIVNK